MSTQPTIRKGSQGAAVKLCQERLNAKGFHVKVDGDFGELTETAVEQFQASCNIKVDGEVGPATWTHLMSAGTVPTPEEVVAEQRAALVAKIPASASPEVRAVLEAAISKLGCKEVPNGSNGGSELAEIVEGPGGDGKVPSAYYLHWKVADKAVLKSMPPWCALFVCYALRVGLKKSAWKDIPFGNWFGGAQQVEDWAKKNGKWSAVGTVPHGPAPAGAAFTISREGSGSDPGKSVGAGHVGFVVCDNGDGTVTTVEGNVGNCVGSYRRSKNALRGLAVWW